MSALSASSCMCVSVIGLIVGPTFSGFLFAGGATVLHNLALKVGTSRAGSLVPCGGVQG